MHDPPPNSPPGLRTVGGFFLEKTEMARRAKRRSYSSSRRSYSRPRQRTSSRRTGCAGVRVQSLDIVIRKEVAQGIAGEVGVVSDQGKLKMLADPLKRARF